MTGSPNAQESGPILFARFAYPPNALGYCGPGDPSGFLESAVEARDEAGVAASAAHFDGAWPYLELIANYNGIDDPLDRRVVDAYWIGSDLLERVPTQALIAHLDGRFERRTRRRFSHIAEAAIRGGRAHHSFHVFAVYPWLDLIRAGGDSAPLVVLDQCRVRSGTVVEVSGDFVTVESRPIALRGHLLVEGDTRLEQVRRSVGGTGFELDLLPGDLVAVHWDWVCRRLSARSRLRLQMWTERSLHSVNSLSTPGPAYACDTRG